VKEPWEKSYKILDEANNKIKEKKKDVSKLLKSQNFSEDEYKKVKELLEDEIEIRNEAIDKVIKIHRDNTENLEQQWDGQ
jgi:hypothetical protein